MTRGLTNITTKFVRDNPLRDRVDLDKFRVENVPVDVAGKPGSRSRPKLIVLTPARKHANNFVRAVLTPSEWDGVKELASTNGYIHDLEVNVLTPGQGKKFADVLRALVATMREDKRRPICEVLRVLDSDDGLDVGWRYQDEV